jgi:hypothetical protein
VSDIEDDPEREAEALIEAGGEPVGTEPDGTPDIEGPNPA